MLVAADGGSDDDGEIAGVSALPACGVCQNEHSASDRDAASSGAAAGWALRALLSLSEATEARINATLPPAGSLDVRMARRMETGAGGTSTVATAQQHLAEAADRAWAQVSSAALHCVHSLRWESLASLPLYGTGPATGTVELHSRALQSELLLRSPPLLVEVVLSLIRLHSLQQRAIPRGKQDAPGEALESMLHAPRVLSHAADASARFAAALCSSWSDSGELRSRVRVLPHLFRTAKGLIDSVLRPTPDDVACCASPPMAVRPPAQPSTSDKGRKRKLPYGEDSPPLDALASPP